MTGSQCPTLLHPLQGLSSIPSTDLNPRRLGHNWKRDSKQLRYTHPFNFLLSFHIFCYLLLHECFVGLYPREHLRAEERHQR